ncbi:MAG: tRNA pseudouridine(55) synthase TruB [bacterium]|nr:tRNA pseudouridine(55) synthase TruB [bacterium]
MSTKKNFKPGIYNIYKPPGPTSHDIVDLIRKLSGEKRVGHAGTLDPFAEGVLIVAVGREYTRQLGRFLKQDKTYRAIIRLGAETETGDLTSPPKSYPHARLDLGKNRLDLGKKEILEVLKKFKGEIEQVPPAFSAIKIKGRRAYELARKGIAPELKARRVKIYSIKILRYYWPDLEIETKVSSGTYIRSLAKDIGQALQTGGYLEKLIRIKIGRFDIKKSLKI